MTRSTCLAALTTLALLTAPAITHAEEKESSSKKDDGEGWGLDLGLYVFLPARTSGNVSVGVIDDTLNLSLRDLFNDYDIGGLAGRVELWTPARIAIAFEGFYQRSEFEDENNLNVGGGPGTTLTLSTETRLAFGDLLLGYRLLNIGGPVPIRLDVFGGVRFTDLKNTLNLASNGRRIDQGTSYNWAEPVFGARVWAKVWFIYASLSADVSGFGLGSASDLTYNVLPAVGFMPGDILALELGWRVFGMDYARGSGGEKVGYDVLQHGPQLAVRLSF